MPCYHPLQAWRTASGAVVFQELKRHGDYVQSLDLPCGQCIGCRLERARQWAVRCEHERKLWKRNCFITLTYADKFLPADQSLNYSDFPLFMKRLRKRFSERRIRFFMAGEYGTLRKRAHYHAILFNHDFDDKVYFKKGGLDSKLYKSRLLDELWGKGGCTVGEANFHTAAYIARYICDKVTGDAAEAHYQGRMPEFTHMSLKPGIGANWMMKYVGDTYPHGRVVINGREANTPRYYDKLYKRWTTDLEWNDVQVARELEASTRRGGPSLASREAVAKARLKTLKRDTQ